MFGQNVRVRAFVAVPLPEPVVDGLVRLQGEIEAGAPGFYRWVDRGQIHLTLYFLGELEDAVADQIRNALRDVMADGLALRVDGIALLPERNTPRIVAAGIGGELDALIRLQQKISDTVFPFAPFKETRRYYPHVTLGRLKHGMPGNAKQLKRTLGEVVLKESDAFRVDGFELMQSHLDQGGPRYETIERFPLT